MERTNRKLTVKIVLVAVALGLFGSLAVGCKSGKKCGCGYDLNGVYKRGRHR